MPKPDALALPLAAALLSCWAAASQAAGGTGEMAVSARVEPRCTARTEGLSRDGQAAVVLDCTARAPGVAPLFEVEAGAREVLQGAARPAGAGATYRRAFDWPAGGATLPVVTITYGGVEGP